MAFTPFVENDLPTMANFNAKFLDAIAAAVGKAPKIEIIEYTGTGTHGSDNPNTLVVPEWTKFVIIAGVASNSRGAGIGIFAKPKNDATGYGAIGIGTGSTGSQYTYGYYAKWVGATLSWYTPPGSGGSTNAYDQLNYAGWTYIVYCVGIEEVTT